MGCFTTQTHNQRAVFGACFVLQPTQPKGLCGLWVVLGGFGLYYGRGLCKATVFANGKYAAAELDLKATPSAGTSATPRLVDWATRRLSHSPAQLVDATTRRRSNSTTRFIDTTTPRLDDKY